MDRGARTIVFAMTGSIANNARAIRQIRVFQQLAETVHVIAMEADKARTLFADNVMLLSYDRPEETGVRFFWSVHRNVKSIAASLKASLYHASDLYVLPAMSQAAHRSAKLTYDARELYPFVAGTVGKPWATLFWSQLEARFAPRADLVMTVNESIAGRLRDAYGIASILVNYNVPSPQTPANNDFLRQTLAIGADHTLFLHQGHLRAGRGGRVLVEAVKRVQRASLVFLGSGPLRSELETLVAQSGLSERVFFVDPVPYEQLLDITASADVGVSLLENTCLNHRLALPNKLFEYLMAGLPVIASDFDETGKLVHRFDVGIAVDPADLDAVARSFERMTVDQDQRARWSANTGRVFEVFNWTKQAEALRATFDGLIELDQTS